ncbi:MAG TPA: HAMP domain-containing protein [Bryobacteraceae bacterium]|nr:HAMP domain-containing protein [Bryobacteraceae bacterium]
MPAPTTPKTNGSRTRPQAAVRSQTNGHPPLDGLDTGLLLRTLVAFQKGDFSVRLPVDQIGIAGKISDTLNAIFEMNDRMRGEFDRISNAVGKEGRITQRASLAGAGGWAACVESVNELIGDLVRPSTEVARVIGAVAEGDLSQTMTLDVDGRALKGEFLHTARVVNTMVEQLNSFANEVTRVAREVGTEGKLGGQANVPGVAGVWKDLTDSVNSMAGNLTAQVRNIAEVSTAIASGDLSKKITVNVQGEILELKNTINTMVDQLNAFAGEVTRVAREVGTEGKLGGQADVKGVAGVWKDLTDNVNLMAGNLTAQVRNIADVTTAVARGDLSRKITVDVRGEILALKNTINTMVDQLNAFAGEVTRVAREVGTEGKLGGQAEVEGVAGVWKDLTDTVNSMTGNLTAQVRNIADVTTAVANGDLSKKITVNVQGEILELKNTINVMVDQLSSFASEVTRVAKEVGTEGKLGGQANVPGVAGTWKDLTDSVNSMAGNLTNQVRNIADVATAVAKGDLSTKITVTARGEILELKNTLNIMVDQLNSFASEVTRVAREVGTEGKLGGQADVKGVAGVWKDLTENVNSMASNLTAQVRNIADVTTAVAKGDLSRKITVDVRGEILELKDTINTMVDQLNSFASEVTRVAREVGTEGKLGGQASVPGVAGVWKDLTDNVNFMAANLTTQVRNIAEVTTAVAKGDLTTKISVDARGEILELKNTINVMVDQLSSFASEVTRVAREVGTEGKLGGQADVRGVAGTWKDLTESVNSMASNLTAQVRNIADVTTAVARGDLSRKITVDVRGEILALKNTINVMVDQLNGFASEVTRVAKEVGTEGKLGGQADVKGVAGVWRDLTESVNSMASNLTAQVRNIADVTTAVAKGDLSRKITVDVRGEILALKDTINTMVDQLSSFASEVTRVAKEVGTEGKLGGQANVSGVAGVWKELTESVNSMASNLTNQVRNIADVTTAVARGDLSRKITVDVRGEILSLKDTINTMVDQLNSFASEVTRVAKEVGTEGKLGGQADVKGVAGVWKDLTENVNSMASNLTAQVRNIADVTTAVAKGDLSRKITVDVRGEILALKDTINVMVDQLSSFASEVTRVAREVGTEGKLGGQANVPGVAGTWKELTESVNSMASNLTNQVRNIAEVTTAVARGDLSRKITVDVRGEILALKDTINVMVDQLSSFASEVTRVAREVGTEGKLGGQADVKGVAGVWRDLTESVNSMASNLTAQVRNIADVTTAVAKGDLSRKITVDVRGEILELKNTINTMVDQLSSFSSEVTRVAREVGTEGKLGGQADVYGVAGTWKDLTESVNSMASNLTNQVRNIADVTTAVAKGDLSRKITVDVRGEILELKNTINTMVDQLNSFASEVTRVAREVGTEGKLGGQAEVRGVAGVWKDLTDNVNIMAANLTTQVRHIAKVVTAVANGDLKRKLVLETKGEIAELADTINGMIDTLATFADQVTSVAREVGIEGKLGGQARVPGAAGIWRDLTDNVNQLAANLTTQVRAIADVATSVTSGDLTRSIAVEAQGEVAALKDNINQMIGTLAETTRQNKDQDWLKTNIAKFTGMLQGQRNLLAVAQLLLSELAPVVGAHLGTFYMAEKLEGETVLRLLGGFGFNPEEVPSQYRIGQSLVGQCARDKARILVADVPGDYIKINSSLGAAAPASVVLLPVLFEGEAKAVIELASFRRFSDVHLAFLDQLTQSIGIVLNTIAATMRTEELLKQSQALAEQLQKTNLELEEKAQLLAEQKAEVETKSREVEQAKAALEEKAEQLALTSKYKSEFLANMSHELRTPLNNLLILAKMLQENPERNLSPKQVNYAETIHASGTDLLALINDILDLSKIESGKMDVEIGSVRFNELQDYCARTFRHVADGKGLEFSVELDPKLPDSIHTDAKRLQQVLKNLLSNALKFTASGFVKLRIERAAQGWRAGHPVLGRAKTVVAFKVIDTGIGIPKEKQKIIFEAFQQADGTTSRKYGGTGLGLSISRELARLLGGEITLESEPGAGSTFTLYLPQTYLGAVVQPKSDSQSGTASFGTAESFAAESSVEVLMPSKPKVQTVLAEEDLAEMVDDDRNNIQPDDLVLLIIEDDPTFARILVDMAHARSLKALVAFRGNTALSLVREFKPAAVTLDILLPDMVGWIILDRLKHDPATRHIPVHIISANEDCRRGLALGAMSHMEKNLTVDSLERTFDFIEQFARRRTRRLLLVCGNPSEAEAIQVAIGGPDLEIREAENAAAALELLNQSPADGICMTVRLPDMDASAFIAALHEKLGAQMPPVMVFAGEGLSESDAREIRRQALSGTIRCAASLERLLDESVLLLHRNEAELSDGQRSLLAELRARDVVLAGRKVLVVDDDLRNIFALSSLLEEHNIRVLHAENGRDGIELLRQNPDIDAVLMDIMMPEMDGYQTMRAIRQIPQFSRLPIVALTAKAMKGDREKCLEAGASEYVTKPVDLEQLFSVLRVWIGAGAETSSALSAANGALPPGNAESQPQRRVPPPSPADPMNVMIDDDRTSIQPGDPVLLIVEDDPTFARILVDIAHERHLKAVVALRGNTALSLAREFKPEAITLDIGLPDMMGWTILDRLKHDPATRHIPVHIISGDEDRRRGLALGAMTYLEKSVSREGLARAFSVIGESASRRVRKLLLVSSRDESDTIRAAIAGEDLEIFETGNVVEALGIIGEKYLDGVAIAHRLENGTAAELIQELQKRVTPYTPPVIVYGQGLTDADAQEIGRLGRASTVRYAPSLERLLDETVLLLHRNEADLSEMQRGILASIRQNDRVLAGRKVLVVDDDLRNIFALSSVLEEHNLKVIHAENGRAGIEALQQHRDIDAVLMDIMMPDMDGLETMRAIRQMPEFRELPIIALTAKAMVGDREKCIEAGATDYVTKPVDLEHLFSVLRVWIDRAGQTSSFAD